MRLLTALTYLRRWHRDYYNNIMMHRLQYNILYNAYIYNVYIIIIIQAGASRPLFLWFSFVKPLMGTCLSIYYNSAVIGNNDISFAEPTALTVAYKSLLLTVFYSFRSISEPLFSYYYYYYYYYFTVPLAPDELVFN